MKKYVQTILYLLWLEIKRSIFKTKYFAEIDVTDNCNLRCKHCYHFQDRKDLKTQELSLSVWEKRFADLYTSGIRAVLLVGGEPALRTDVLMLADKIFPLVYVITNGTIRLPDEFKHRLFVSIDGLSKTNDDIRGEGVFSRVIKNYSGDKRVIINMTLTTDNYKELEGVIKIADDHGFDGVVCNICAGGLDFSSSMVVKENERTPLIEELKKARALYPKRFLMTNAMIKWYEYPDHTRDCPWRDGALHLDVSWNKRRCFSNADCTNCGCLAGSFQTPLKMLRELRKMVKIAVYP
jgi:MoaA/NifB/PqqE/SkfB family radical SAM enzyme